MQLFSSFIVAATLMVPTAQQQTSADNPLVPSTFAQVTVPFISWPSFASFDYLLWPLLPYFVSLGPAQIYQRAVEGAFSYRTYLRGAESRALQNVREAPTQPTTETVEGRMMQEAAVAAGSVHKVHANGGCHPPTCFVYWPHHTKKPTRAPTSKKKPTKAEEAVAMM